MNIHQQRGAALVVGLVIMLIVTLLAVTGIGTARLELLMAGNMQFQQQAFQAAEAGLERRFLEAADFNTDWTTSNSFTDFTFGGANEITVTTTGRHLGVGLPPAGYSLGGEFAAFHFEITSTAVGMRGASTELVQGFYIVGPGN